MQSRWIGALLCALGLAVAWITSANPDSLNGPVWLGLATGGVFVIAGVVVATQETPLAPWSGPLGAGLILSVFAAVTGWIAFGDGPRACSGGIDLPLLSTGWSAGEVQCRVAFGYAAVLVDAVLLLMIGSTLAHWLGDGPWARRVQKVGEWGVLLALSPFVILLLLWSAVAGLARRWRA